MVTLKPKPHILPIMVTYFEFLDSKPDYWGSALHTPNLLYNAHSHAAYDRLSNKKLLANLGLFNKPPMRFRV